MDKAINTGGVNAASTQANTHETWAQIITNIDHELTSEKLQELVAFLEPLILRAITIWAKL